MVFTCFFLNLFLGVLTASFEKSSGAALMTLGEKQWNAAQRMMVRLRSALYNWPAKIEHWPAGFPSSNMFLKTRPYYVLCLFYQYRNRWNRPANAQFWSANCKVHSLDLT